MTSTDIDRPDPTKPAPHLIRKRLPAAVRTTQILDAALRMFSEKGFVSSRIDDIAAAAGLSKGGVYTHFKNKEEIFEALLTRALIPPPKARAHARDHGPVTVDLLIEQVVEPMYRLLGHPDSVATLRLLVADGARMQLHVRRWREAMVEPHAAAMEKLVRRGVRQGNLRKSALVRAPWLMMAPGVHAILGLIVFGEAAPVSLAAHRKAHVAMLRELLEK